MWCFLYWWEYTAYFHAKIFENCNDFCIIIVKNYYTVNQLPKLKPVNYDIVNNQLTGQLTSFGSQPNTCVLSMQVSKTQLSLRKLHYLSVLREIISFSKL